MDINTIKLYEDDNLIILNKPPELLSQGDKKASASLQSILSKHMGQPMYIVNRLDRPVSGAILFAKNKEQQNLLSQSKIIKKYVAVVHKSDALTTGILTHYHMKDGKRMKAYISESPKTGYKQVSMNIEMIKPMDNYDLVYIELLSGRFHQIRSQLAFIKAPIKGDVKYGARRKNENRSIMLHAHEMNITEREIQVIAPFPADIQLWDKVVE
jgi:23S rRNA pseudouridine1911/1915/1917 synthase